MEADASDNQRRPYNLVPATSDDSDDPEVVFGDHTELMDSIANYELKEQEDTAEVDQSVLRADA